MVKRNIFQINKNNKGIDIEEKVPGYQHHDGLWFENSKHDSYAPLAEHIYKYLISGKEVASILELGSGAGSLAYHLRQLDPDLVVVTVDANKETIESPYVHSDYHFIARTDEELDFHYEDNQRVVFDLVLSFEHFEHIPHSKFDVLLNNIKRHVSENSLCFCSVADWGGPGIYEPHCNVKSMYEWIIFLSTKGFELENSIVLGDIPAPFNFKWIASSDLLFRLQKEK